MAMKKDIDEIRQHLEAEVNNTANKDKNKSLKKETSYRNVKEQSHRNLPTTMEMPKPVDSSQEDSVSHDKKLSKDSNVNYADEKSRPGKNLEIKEEVYEVEVVEYLHLPRFKSKPDFHSQIHSQRKNIKSKGKRKFPLSFAAGVILIVVFFLGFANALATLSNEGTLSSPSNLIRDRTQTVSGIVRSSDGQPIEGVQVTVLEGSMSDITDMEGWYVIKGISLGKHKVKAELPGYKTVTKEIELSNAYPRTVDFVLEPGDGYEYISLEEKSSTNNLEGQSVTSAGIMLLFSFFGLVGAALSMMRRYYQFAIFFAAISTLSIGFIFGSILALTALVLIFAARAEFPMDKRKIIEEESENRLEECNIDNKKEDKERESKIETKEKEKEVNIEDKTSETCMQIAINDEVNIQKEDSKQDAELTTLGSCNICTQKIIKTETVFNCKCGTVLHKSCLKRVGICPDCKRRYALKKDVEKMKADLNKLNKPDLNESNK